MLLATKTLEAIEAAMQADQGATYRKYLGEFMPLAGDAYNPKHEDFRNHLGASLIGRKCARELWYSFHWATLTRFDGRMLRLFNRGHLEEPRFLALLKMIGCEVWQQTGDGKQFRILGYRGHFGGSLDGVARGLPDLPDQPVLTEFKTHGDKSFVKLKSAGVMAAKWEHFVQMTLYMGYYNLQWALYAATNKNDDALHMELVQFDPKVYTQYNERPVNIIDAKTPPPKINTSPGWYECRFCDQQGVCQGKDLPARNCRTCVHSEVANEGRWHCLQRGTPEGLIILNGDDQRAGCEFYTANEAFKK